MKKKHDTTQKKREIKNICQEIIKDYIMFIDLHENIIARI